MNAIDPSDLAPDTPAQVEGDSIVATSESADWLQHLWTSDLSTQERDVLSRRTQGTTLEEIGQGYGVTRERIRQVETAARRKVDAAFTRRRDELHALDDLLKGRLVVEAAAVMSTLPAAPEAARRELLRFVGLKHPQTWDGQLLDWWCYDSEELDRRLKVISDLGPMSHENMAAAMQDVGLEMTAPVSDLLASSNSRLIRHDLGWIRPNRISRDIAYLWLEAEGSPRSAGDIAAVTTNSERAIRETMRRDEYFAQVRPEGTWALAAWKTPGTENHYKSAEEVLIDVLREMGPMDLSDLSAEVRRRYPVTAWRISQCLSNSKVGRTPDGKYDLAERGAEPIEEVEPRRPDHIKVSGNVVGVVITVDYDLMRGSGLHVNRWLPWYLGLRTQPSERQFELVQPAGTVTIRRASSNAQISSLRSAAMALDVAEGCELVLLLNTANNTARLHHGCEPSRCPAASAG